MSWIMANILSLSHCNRLRFGNSVHHQLALSATPCAVCYNIRVWHCYITFLYLLHGYFVRFIFPCPYVQNCVTNSEKSDNT